MHLCFVRVLNYNMNGLIEKARAFAITAHGDQKYGGKPYYYHLRQVEQVLIDSGYSEEKYIITALLHDTIEDTATSQLDIETEFGKEIANAVFAVTGVGKNRKERNASIYEKINGNELACAVKAADRIANLESTIAENNLGLMKMYGGERDAFIDAIFGISSPLTERLTRAYNLIGLAVTKSLIPNA